MEDKEVSVEHILREGNQLANFSTNHILCFAGIQRLTYSNFQVYQLRHEESSIQRKQNFLDLG
ncbi:hypothetical protein R3W88_032982 [Solanum pinnatisectum]|uniref:Uncharacterized protein n=1 Tax=Solanum pinnatisectum TaxID=50273 RepID=A0AAV9K4F2_9SOLN|nr:hypothetical protein R3W88_032982 [Solanum pinnatisectum]